MQCREIFTMKNSKDYIIGGFTFDEDYRGWLALGMVALDMLYASKA